MHNSRFNISVLVSVITFLIVVVATLRPSEADIPAPMTASSAWQDCGTGVFNIDQYFDVALPCIADKSPKDAQQIVAYLISPDGRAYMGKTSLAMDGGDVLNVSSIQLGWDKKLLAVEQKVRLALQPKITSEIITSLKAPVTLLSCNESHALDDPQWQIDASWQSVSNVVTAIKLRVQTENAFGDVLQTDDLAPTGVYSPDAISSDSWTIGDLHMPARANVSKIKCEIVAAIFQDGSTWKAPTTASPVPRIRSTGSKNK